MRSSWHNTPQTLNQTRVMIVEDHPLFRAGLESTLKLEDHIEVTGFCVRGDEVLEAIALQKPDVILMDVNLPEINGLEVTRRLQGKYHHIAVIILTAHHDQEQTLHALRCGASAYYPKDIDGECLIEVIEAVRQGFYVVGGQRMTGEQVNAWMQARLGHHQEDLRTHEAHLMPLSGRELEILRCVANGLLNKQIAVKLGISQQTVKNHMTSILRKMNVADRTQAVIMALRRGWVRLSDEAT